MAGKKLLSPLVIAFLVFTFLSSLALDPTPAEAFPFFSRQIGRDCTYCHTLFPKLNETGRIYRSNGYRFEGEGEWKEIKDITGIPASLEVEVEGIYNKIKTGGLRTETSDAKIEEVEISAGGAFGKSGKVTVLGTVLTGQTDTGTDTRINKALVQINDLIGDTGAGVLNLRAGQWDIGLPFLTPARQVILNTYLASSAMDVLTLEQRAFEVNGSVLSDEESMLPTHRYSVGLARENVYDDNKLRGYYATYSATFKENYSIGAIFRGGHEKNGALDVRFNKLGLAAEAEKGPFILTAGFFRSIRSSASDLNDYLAEAFYKPLPKLSLGLRFENLREKGKKSAKSQSLMARYNILSNVFAQLEYRGLNDTGHVAGLNEDEDKLRLIFVAAF